MTKKTKEIGTKIGMRLRQIKAQEKALRTLRKEKEVREKSLKLAIQIKQLKSQRPTFLKKALKVGKRIGKGISQVAVAQRTAAEKIKKKKPLKYKNVPIQKEEDIMDLVNRL